MTEGVESKPFGKSELAVALKWSRSRLDRRLDQDPNFPVKKRGTRAGGWEFELAEVLQYLGKPALRVRRGVTKARGSAARHAPAVPSQDGDADTGAHHQGEMTAAQRLKNAQAAREEDKLRLARGELVEAEEMRMTLGTMLAHLGKGLEGLPDALVRRLGLPEEAGDTIRELVDDLRRNMVAELKTLLA